MSNTQELDRPDNVEGDSNESCLVPPEIWLKIFKLVPQPRSLSKFRPVCKLWQGVIDENFDMKVKINEDKMDVNSIIHFKRVSQCIISKLIEGNILPPLGQIFCDPTLLSSLVIRGTISRPNFLVIAHECQNVKELILTGFMLTGDTQLFEVESQEETDILSNFMNGMQKLVVNGLHIGMSEKDTTPVNVFSLLNWQMNNLKHLVVRVSYPDTAEDKRFFQLLENFGSLESIEFTSRSFSVPLQYTPFVLPNLTTLNIEVRVQERLVDWLPFISAQNSIVNLKIVISHEEGFELRIGAIEAILRNKDSLQILEMRKLCKTNTGDCDRLFSGMVNLKSLTLHGAKNPKVYHLNVLPPSVETLVLENFKVENQDFERVSKRIVNLLTRNIKGKICLY